jgi:ABC-type nickel/cobalt efflux system permease component RcnA
MRHGLSKGFATSMWALGFTIVWSAIEYDLNHRQFWIQIGMPTIVTFTAFVMWKQGRLRSDSDK